MKEKWDDALEAFKDKMLLTKGKRCGYTNLVGAILIQAASDLEAKDIDSRIDANRFLQSDNPAFLKYCYMLEVDSETMLDWLRSI